MYPHMLPPIFFGLRIIGVVIGIWVASEQLMLGHDVEAVRYLCVWIMGSLGVLSGLGNCFFDKKVAESMGWRPGTNFQKELGYMHFAFAITAVFAFAFRLGSEAFLLALLPYMLFYFFCSCLHFYNALRFRHYTWHTLSSAILIWVMIAFVLYIAIKSQVV